MVWTFIRWRDVSLNVVTDSLYVAGIVSRIEDASVRDLKNQCLTVLLVSLQLAITQRSESYAVIHIRSHQWEEGLGEGNARADHLVAIATEPPLAPHCRA